VTRAEEIAEILRVQGEIELANQARVEKAELEARQRYKSEVMSGKRTMFHAGCAFCAGRVADLLPVSMRECALNSARSAFTE
jgi:hypothetical protein